MSRMVAKMIQTYNIEFRYVPAHTEGENARTWVNNWCDEQAKIWRRKREKQICNIEIENSTVSRLQCTIYQKDNNWYLVDSDGGITNETMNGTWVLAEEYYQITNNTIFRSGTTIFKCMIKIKAI